MHGRHIRNPRPRSLSSARIAAGRARMSSETISLITIPLFTGAIGYVTNWSGVLDAVLPGALHGLRVPGLAPLAHLLPRRIQQIPGVMQGGVGWQGIIPSRAAKMGSIAVDKGIAKLGSPATSTSSSSPRRSPSTSSPRAGDIRDVVERIMEREHPRAVARPAAARARGRPRARPGAAARDRARGHRRDRQQHRPAARREADGDPPHRGAAPSCANRDLPRGRAQGAAVHHQLRLLLRLRARHPDGDHHRVVLPQWWVLPIAA